MTIKELTEIYARQISKEYQKVNKKLLVSVMDINTIADYFKTELLSSIDKHTFTCKYCGIIFFTELGRCCPECARFQ